MISGKGEFTINSHFDDKTATVRRTYNRLIEVLKLFGPIVEEPKKTSIHIVNATAFAGVATRKNHLVLTIKSDSRLKSPRIQKTDQSSAKRFYHEIKLSSPAEIDRELIGWLKVAYALGGDEGPSASPNITEGRKAAADEPPKGSAQDEWMDYREAARVMHRPKEYFLKRWLDGQFKYWPEIERWQPGGYGSRLYVRREHVERWIEARHSFEQSPIRQILKGIRL